MGVPALLQAEAGLDHRDAAAWSCVGTATSLRTSLTGQALPPLRPALAAAVREGAIALGAADRIARALRGADGHASPEQIDEFERILAACAPRLSERELRIACRRVIDLVDPDGAAPREDELRRRTSLTIVQQDDGLTRLTALLHPKAAAFVLAALNARTAPRRHPVFAADEALLDAPDDADRRPLALRRAEALADIARDALSHDAGHVAGAPVTVMVTMTVDQLADGLGVARISGIDEPISAGTARLMAADAEVIPVVLGSDSEILDQGRSCRLATVAQRRALDVRDQGCVWGGCSAPPSWCEVAHLHPWFLGGVTDLKNLALMCSFHHHLFDRDGWALRWRDGIPWLIPPSHVDPARTPRRAGPPSLVA